MRRQVDCLDTRTTGKQMPLAIGISNHSKPSDPNSVRGRERRVHDIARVPRVRGFKHENLRFGLGHRAMFDTPWEDAKFPRLQCHETVAELNGHQILFIG